MKTKKFSLIIIFIIIASPIFAQNNRFSKIDIKNKYKNNIWVLDTIESFTGQGSTVWDFDYTEIVKERNLNGSATLIETKEKLPESGHKLIIGENCTISL